MKYPKVVFVALGVALLATVLDLVGTLQSAPSAPDDLRDALKEETFVFKVGDKVIPKIGPVGEVKSVIIAGTLQYVVQTYGSAELKKYPASDLARTTGACTQVSSYKFCIGDKVINRSGTLGVVKGIFPSGTLSVRIGISPTNTMYSGSDLARTTEACTQVSSYKFCIGDKVINRNGSSGVVEGIFPSGTLSVRIGISPANTMYSASDLARTTGACVQGSSYEFCIGDKVINRSGTLGVVKGIFPSGTLSVRIGISPANTMYSGSDLARTTGACAQGSNYKFCIGDKVINRSGSSGVVEGIFPSGTLSVRIGISPANTMYSGSDLAHGG